MTTSPFLDSRLDDPQSLATFEPLLRHTASTGARLRSELADGHAVLAAAEPTQPRAVVAIGTEARLIRAVLEPTCPVPFIAWPGAGLPHWVGPLDVVLALTTGEPSPEVLAEVHEATRRGCHVVVVAPPDSEMVRAAGRQAMVLPVRCGDAQVAALVAVMALHRLGLGPSISVESVARAADEVAATCGPASDLAHNPGKIAAVAMADSVPLLWGGSVLASRATRRVAEAWRRHTGQLAFAGDTEAIEPVLSNAPRRDVFADPDDVDPTRPCLVLLVEGEEDLHARALRRVAEARDVRVHLLTARADGLLERYLQLLMLGNFAAIYSSVGLGRTPIEP